MRRFDLPVIAVLGILLAAHADARPGIYEYFKAGTKRGRSKSDLPPGHSRARPSSPTPASARAVPPWSEAWFSDSTLVRRGIDAMTEAMAIPMIGQTYPLPRGGGFVCTRPEGGDPDAKGLRIVLRCVGPELGGQRQNWFYASAASPAMTLDRVRWVIHAPPGAPRAPWRALYFAVADSLSRVMGPPAWSGADSTKATWTGIEFSAAMRVHGAPAHVDSLEIECVSARLATGARPTGAP